MQGLSHQQRTNQDGEAGGGAHISMRRFDRNGSSRGIRGHSGGKGEIEEVRVGAHCRFRRHAVEEHARGAREVGAVQCDLLAGVSARAKKAISFSIFPVKAN